RTDASRCAYEKVSPFLDPFDLIDAIGQDSQGQAIIWKYRLRRAVIFKLASLRHPYRLRLLVRTRPNQALLIEPNTGGPTCLVRERTHLPIGNGRQVGKRMAMQPDLNHRGR